MSKTILNRRAIVAAVVLLGLVGFRVYFTRPKEPVYQGKTLTEWIVQYHRYSNAHSEEALQDFRPKVVEAENAIQAIGTNAIPFLLQKLTAKNSRPIMAMNDFLDRQSLIGFRFSDARWERTWANAGFDALGEAGRPACPELFKLLNDPNPQVIPNAKINFRNGKGTEPEGGKQPDESGERKSHGFGNKKTH